MQTARPGHMFKALIENIANCQALQILRPRTSDIAKQFAKPGFWFLVRPEPCRVTLPVSLQSLEFGDMFDQSLGRVSLPSGLQTLIFGHSFNQSFEEVTLPSGLHNLEFGNNFVQSLEHVTLPSNLQSLTT